MKYAVIKSLVIGGKNADVELRGFGTENKIELEKELLGETEKLKEWAYKSGESPALYGVEFTLGERRRTSVLTFHGGLLADVAECNLHFGTDNPELKVYGFKGAKLGVIVDDDIDSELIWQKLCEQSDGIIAFVREFEPQRRSRVEKLQAYFKLPIVVCAGEKLYSFGAESAESFDL